MYLIKTVKPSVYKGLREKETTDVEKSCVEEGYYASIDLGTTTIALEVYDEKQKIVTSTCVENSQTVLGADVIMRMMHCLSGRQEQLRDMIRQQVDQLLQEGVKKVHGAGSDIRRITIVGNTAMCHIFLDQSVEGLAAAPFRAAYHGKVVAHGKDLGLLSCSNAEVIILPGLDAHVGADAISVTSFLQLWNLEKVQVAVDIGTNAEILLNYHGKLYAGSVAAGPAFEGSGISCGKRGGDGVISSVTLSRGNDNVVLGVISSEGKTEEPKGICGSGLVELISEMARLEFVTRDGYLEKDFILYKNANNRSLSITQKDVRNFQLAKAAVQAGIREMLNMHNLTLKDIDDFYLAGVFGNNISIKHGVAIGLLPDISKDRIHFIGNAALEGAVQALFSEKVLEKMEKVASETTLVEYTKMESFRDVYMDSMALDLWQ